MTRGRLTRRHRQKNARERADVLRASPDVPPEKSEAPLLRAILDTPEEDAPRLVYADYLEERGADPARRSLGELIHIECELARASSTDARSLDDERRQVLLARRAELDKLHAKAWLSELWALKLPRTRFELRRGFVEVMTSPISIATMHAEEILARAPLVRDLRLSVDGQVDRVELARPRHPGLLRQATDISLSGRRAGNTRFGLGPLARLGGLASIPMERLRALRLSTLRLADPAELAALLASPALRSLEHLEVRLSLEARAIATVFEGPFAWAGTLRHLDLSDNPFGDEGPAELVRRVDCLRGLVELSLQRTNLSVVALPQLHRLVSQMPTLERVDMSNNRDLIGVDASATLARALEAWPKGLRVIV